MTLCTVYCLKWPMSIVELVDKWVLVNIIGAHLCISHLCLFVCVFLYVYLPLGTGIIVHCVAAVLNCPMSTVELVAKWGLLDMTRHDAQRSR